MKITTLLFDLDGTLVDSARESAVILNAMRNERGRGPCDISLFQEKISSGAKGLIECALGFCKEDTESLIKEFRAKYQTTQTPKSSLYPNVIETLTQLRTIGYSLGVVTNKPDNLCHNVLIQTGLFQFFDCIIAATGNIKPKPHPEPIHTALQKMGRKKNESILIGDSRPDQLAAAQAGIPFIFFTEGYDDGVNQADVFASISHHQDLLTKKLFLSLPLAGKTK
jgi:phosphoglycolate phosphatase